MLVPQNLIGCRFADEVVSVVNYYTQPENQRGQQSPPSNLISLKAKLSFRDAANAAFNLLR